ncbi:regulator of telomere elongation helicase 1 [Angomonas deanei]|nr:regulator of telomere elongation helicase 1 [Angomonas deanei]|eukprot:EPY26516.1 regulator of telomere elongation helicase 1 [Angomonas deanei]
MSKNVLINDVEVEFPFEPYAAQKDYMESVVAALDGGKNGLLESPTGTGKTLCLLCAVLAWKRKHDGVRKRQVIYCSRTHSQLSQVIRELKKTSYAEKVSMSVLGSREHMCVNSEVLRLPSAQSQQSLCNSLRADKACRFYRSVQNKKVVELPLEVQVHDIEDLKVDAKKCGYCPYYFEREAAVNSDVVFLPYNYIFDKTISKQLPFKLDGSILIVDEAHNLPGVLSSTSCVDLHPLELANCIHECTRAVAFCEQKATNGESSTEDLSLLIEEFSSLKIVLRQLEESVEKIGSASPSGEVVHPGSFMHHFLSQVLITPDIYFGAVGKRGLNDIINSAIEQLALTEKGATGLVQFQRLLENAFNHELPDHSTKFIVRASGGTPPANETPKYILSLWFLDASFYLREVVANLHSFILTSGTLSPLDHFEAELGVPFQVQLKGRHVIGASQIVSSVLCRGPSNEKLNGSYAFRNSVDYQVGLGMTVVNLSRVTPGGSVVFFPSYAALNAALNVWKKGNNTNEKTVWGLLTEIKPVFVEPNTTSDLAPIVTEFQQAVDSNRRKGALFLAICRGKVSEGIDFSDHHGRSVMVTGIPFANSADLFVRLKRGYIDSISRERPLVRGKPFTGDDWYKNEAMRAVNQALGRVIRHKDDYGALLLVCVEVGCSTQSTLPFSRGGTFSRSSVRYSSSRTSSYNERVG